MPSPEQLAADPNATDAQIPTPPPFYHSASQAASASIAAIRSSLHKFPTPILKIQRVNQLDAELLDRELAELLLDPVKKALGTIRSTLASDAEPELLLLLKLALFKFSIVDRGASYGSMLQNLKYRNEWAHRGALQSTARDQPLSRLQLALYPLLTIVAPYLGAKWQGHMTSLSYSDMPNNDPRRLLGPEEFERWKALGAKFIALRSQTQLSWDGPAGPDPDVIVVGDRTGALKKFFDTQTDSVLFLRPDRCIAGACIAQRTPELSADLVRALDLTGNTPKGGESHGEPRTVLHVAQPTAEPSGTVG